MSDSDSGNHKVVILAILDWGLGHASRMIPVIDALHDAGWKIVLASAGDALELLKMEYPHHIIEEIPAYDIRYSHSSGGLPLAMMRQAPRILRLIIKEREEVKALAEKHSANVIISDNRFGARVTGLKNIFITHQLFIRSPFLLKPAQWLSRILNHRMISKFDECWVPDFEGKINLSGELSHLRKLQGKVRFIGPLSRFTSIETDSEETAFDYELLIILSGPEPQRSNLERKLIMQAESSSLRTVLVRGKTKDQKEKEAADNIHVIHAAGSDELFELMKNSRLIICRSGYSSIMDLAATGKEALLIPTPGQTEQEYLAHRFKKEKVFYSEKQSTFNLMRALEASHEYNGLKINMNDKLLGKALDSLSPL